MRVSVPFEPWEPKAAEGVSLVVGLQDPVNLGAAVRLAAAFGVSQVVTLAEAASPYLPRSLRAAGPAVLEVPFRAGPALGDLVAGSLPLIGLSAEGDPLPAFTFPERCALVAGLEGPGLPADLPLTTRLAVPIATSVESLNAASALAIALYAYRLQHPR